MEDFEGGIVSRDSEHVSKEAWFGLPLDKILGCPSCCLVTADQPHGLMFLLKPFCLCPFPTAFFEPRAPLCIS